MKLTQRALSALQPQAADTFAWDDELPGFGVRVKPSGHKSFVIQCRVGRRSHRVTLGSCSLYKVEEARDKARRMLIAAKDGKNPAAERDAIRTAPTMRELAERYLSDHAEPRKKASSVAPDRRNLQNHVLPLLGSLLVQQVTRADVDAFMRKVKAGATARDDKLGPRARRIVRGGAGVANRCFALLSKMMNLAEKWGMRPDGSNPCRHVEKNREGRIERFLSADELAHLGAALAEAERTRAEAPAALAAIRLLVFTGARLSEILTARWQYFDVQSACLRLPDSKTGAKVVHLNAPALEVVAALASGRTSPWLIAGSQAGRPLVNLHKPWRRIRAAATLRLWSTHPDPAASGLVARLRTSLGRWPSVDECRAEAEKTGAELPRGLTDVRLHDLRHSFASVGAAGGLSLPMIGALLGHAQPATTARYAHLAADPLRQASDAIAQRIASAMKGDQSATVVELAQRRA